MTDDIAIKVNHVSKSFKLPHEKNNSLKSKLINFNKRGYEVQHALKDISFEIKKGEFFGIVGRNGSGKSTLLKMLAGIYSSDKGNIEVDGKLTPFIELGVGFNPELSGRDNVFLNGALLGFDRKQMETLYEEIVKFAELERFMDQKLKNYSSGMQVRLAFSIAIQTTTDILVLDEVLAVGDAAFQKKCFSYFAQIKEKGITVVLVSHDMGAIKKFCDKAIMIEKGVVVARGLSSEVGDAYDNLFLSENVSDDNSKNTDDFYNNKYVKALSSSVSGNKPIESGKDIDISISYEANTSLYKGIFYSLQMVSSSGLVVFATDSGVHNLKAKPIKKGEVFTLDHHLKNIFINDAYHLNVTINNFETGEEIFKQKFISEFSLVGSISPGIVQIENTMNYSLGK